MSGFDHNRFVMKMSSDDSVLWSAAYNISIFHNPIAIDDKEQSLYIYGFSKEGATVLNLDTTSGFIINQK